MEKLALLTKHGCWPLCLNWDFTLTHLNVIHVPNAIVGIDGSKKKIKIFVISALAAVPQWIRHAYLVGAACLCVCVCVYVLFLQVVACAPFIMTQRACARIWITWQYIIPENYATTDACCNKIASGYTNWNFTLWRFFYEYRIIYLFVIKMSVFLQFCPVSSVNLHTWNFPQLHRVVGLTYFVLGWEGVSKDTPPPSP